MAAGIATTPTIDAQEIASTAHKIVRLKKKASQKVKGLHSRTL
jgi:hypothetical protein